MSSYQKGLSGGSTNRTFYNLIATALSVGAVAFSIYALSGQTGDLLSFFDENEDAIAGVQADGDFYGPNFISRFGEAGQFDLNTFYDSIPAGLDTQIQFNDNGTLAGDSSLIWDNSNKRLQIDGNGSPSFDLEIGNTTGTTDRQIRLYGGSGLQFRIFTNSSQTGIYGTRDLFISTNTTSRQVYIVPGGGATVEFDNNQTTFFRAMGYPIRTITTSTTIGTTDHTVLVDTSGGAVTITLPTASSAASRLYNIKKITSDPNKVTIDGNGSETIDGAATAEMTTQYESLTIQSNSTEWWIL